MTREEAKVYFIDSNKRIISVAKDENRYNYKTQQIEDVFMRRDFEANELAIKALEQEPILDKIRAEIDQYLFQNEFGSEYRKEVSQIIDKYKAESEPKQKQTIQCKYTDEEIAKSFINDVSAVEGQLVEQTENLCDDCNFKGCSLRVNGILEKVTRCKEYEYLKLKQAESEGKE